MDAEQSLYEAAIRGRLDLLNKAIGADELILDKVLVGRCSGGNPLHVAAIYGHTAFAEELLRLRPKLAQVLDSADRLALHVAAAEGAVGVAKALIDAKSSMCLARDREGMNFLHVAAVNGKVELLNELVPDWPHAARARADRDETILHLCVKHNQDSALERLLDMIGDREFVDAKDAAGNTVLHLAVSGEQFEIVKRLLEQSKININAKNESGHTAMDVLFLSRKAEDGKNSTCEENTASSEIEDLLRQAKAKRSKDLVQGEWVSKKRDALMVVASLIATMAFQAAVNPPGGVWQDDSPTHRAGEAVMAYNYVDSYPWFLRSATVGFVASLSIILLLISGLPMKKKIYMWILMVIMWLTITAMAATYAVSIVWVTPKKDRKSLIRTIGVAVSVFCSVIVILLLVHTARLLNSVIKERQSRNRAIDRIKKRIRPSNWPKVAQIYNAGEMTQRQGGQQPNAHTRTMDGIAIHK
ncbi:hypothetical protein NMG60_11003550 [Bertholletia excelsa]